MRSTQTEISGDMMSTYIVELHTARVHSPGGCAHIQGESSRTRYNMKTSRTISEGLYNVYASVRHYDCEASHSRGYDLGAHTRSIYVAALAGSGTLYCVGWGAIH